MCQRGNTNMTVVCSTGHTLAVVRLRSYSDVAHAAMGTVSVDLSIHLAKGC